MSHLTPRLMILSASLNILACVSLAYFASLSFFSFAYFSSFSFFVAARCSARFLAAVLGSSFGGVSTPWKYNAARFGLSVLAEDPPI